MSTKSNILTPRDNALKDQNFLVFTEKIIKLS